MILHHFIRLEHIGPDLIAPLWGEDDAAKLVSLLLLLGKSLRQEFAAQNFHGGLAILQLGTLILTGDNNIRWNVHDAYCRVGGLHRLSTVARGKKCVHSQFIWFDFDFRNILKLWQHFHKRETRMPHLFGVKRRNAHQPVHARFAF